MKKNLSKILTYGAVVIFFLALAYSFVPQVLGGKIVNQSDISGYIGMANQTHEWDKAHPDDKALWTGSMFGGMPTIMLTGNTKGDFTSPLYDLMLLGKRPATYLFISLLGAFLLMLSLGINGLIAVGGAIAVTFCSYNMQIIQVGHNTKMQAIAFLPYVLAALIFTYRKALSSTEGKGKYSWLPLPVLGAVLFALAVDFQIKANHIQISYYLAIIIFSYVAVLLCSILFNKENRHKIGRFFAASFLLLFVGGIGIATNANHLIPMYEYSHHTMRGGSELAKPGEEKSKGLDLEYATSWSYGWEELPNMLIPDFNGGSSAGAVNPEKSETVKLLKSAGQPNVNQIAKALPLYFGPQPFTAGPMYMGAISVFLFILGLLLYKGNEKWWILIPTVIAVLLAVGNHFMPFTEFWYYNMPMYSKFRTVSMALIILQFTIPMLGFLVLDRIIRGEYSPKDVIKSSLIAGGIVIGFSIFAYTGIGRNFVGAGDSQQPEVLVNAFIADRKMLLRNDSLTVIFLIVVTLALILWSYSTKNQETLNGRKKIAGVSIACLILVNMFIVDKRYLNSDHFVPPKDFTSQFAEKPVDKLILEDKSLNYRVLDLTANVFNDSHASYRHNSIGGYSPVKLQRYQDLIDMYLVSEINSVYTSLRDVKTVSEASDALPYTPVISMLNGKYFIISPDAAPVVNKNAFGNAWFVHSLHLANSPEEEIASVETIDLRKEAVVTDENIVASINSAPADTLAASDVIELTSYSPNELKYRYKTSKDRYAVFSEIYYGDGWTASLEDGTPVDLYCTNWILRGAVLPGGEHEIVMKFEPKSYTVGTNISIASSVLLFILLIIGSLGAVVQYRKNSESASK